MSVRIPRSLPVLLAAGCLASTGMALAQSCQAPLAIPPNTVYAFDTCQGGSSLLLACGVIPLAGPATVFDLQLPYPLGLVSLQSLDNNFQPTAFLLHADCSNDAPCSAVIQAGSGELIDLSTLDSGHYFLVVTASANTLGSACGAAAVTATVTPGQEAGMLEGVFRSGIRPLWQP